MTTITPSDPEWFVEVTTLELIKELLNRVEVGSVSIISRNSDELHVFVTDDMREAARITHESSKRLAYIVKQL